MYGSSHLMPPKSIRSKADALQFAILVTMKQNDFNEPSVVDYEEADKLFQFFCDRVTFAQESTSQILGVLLPIIEEILAGKTSDDSLLQGLNAGGEK